MRIARVVLLALLMAACSEATPLEPGEIQPELAACLEEAGYSSDDLGPRPTGEVPQDSPWADPEVLASQARCIVETGIGEVEGDEPDEVDAQNQQAITMTNCLREAGWEVDDPDRHPVFGYLLPPTPTIPSDPGEADALMDDLTACAEEAGIPIELEP
jgi:hypothetical protein